MPIKRTAFPTPIVPQLNSYAKSLILIQFNWMTRFFTMTHAFNSKNTYVDVYYKEVVKEQNIKEEDLDLFMKKYPNIANANYESVLKPLRNELTDSRQRNYCRDIFNRMALYISNAIGDSIVTGMLDNYIDEEVDVILSESYRIEDTYSPKRIDVKIAGTLSSLVSESEKYNMEHLVLTGYLNSSDIKFLLDIIDFCDSEWGYEPPKGKLTHLDLENAMIVEGGEPYLKQAQIENGIRKEIVYYNKENMISEKMFYSTALQSIVLPRNTISINDEAFMDCSELKYVAIPISVISIHRNAFWNCRQIKSIDIPSKVSFIGCCAFACDSLTIINCKNPSPPKVGEYNEEGNLFHWDDSYNAKMQTNVRLYVPVGSSQLYKTSKAWRNFKIILES